MYHRICARPKYKDICKHGRKCFVDTVRTYEDGKVQEFDVYVYTNVHGGTDVCIRWGNKGHEYYSPGTLANVFMTHNMPPYRAAAEVIREAFNIILVRK